MNDDTKFDIKFFEIMNVIGDAARERGDLDTVDLVIKAMLIYMKGVTNLKQEAA